MIQALQVLGFDQRHRRLRSEAEPRTAALSSSRAQAAADDDFSAGIQSGNHFRCAAIGCADADADALRLSVLCRR